MTTQPHALLLEIGTEEIPARFGQPALDQLKTNMTKALKEVRLDFASLEVYGTPRRLILSIQGLATTQRDVELSQKGPSKKAALIPLVNRPCPRKSSPKRRASPWPT